MPGRAFHEHLAVLAVNESAAIEFRCRGTPQGRKIATNSFGIREMSVKTGAGARVIWA
jgi:hypothetical protein